MRASKLETTHVPVNSRTNKSIVLGPLKWNPIQQLEKYTQTNMTQDHVESRKPDTEDYGLRISIYKMYKNM